MDLRRAVARALSEVSAGSRMFARRTAGFRLLLYHAVGSEVPDDPRGIFSMQPQRFAEHLRILSRSQAAGRAGGQRIVGLLEGLDWSDEPRIAVTFDDGYRDNLSVAAPLLIEHGIPFTVFVTTSYVTSGDDLYLSPSDLRELASNPGVTIGAHGVSHTALTTLDDERLDEELVASKHYLEDLLGQRVTSLAYPYGAVDTRVRDASARAGYEVGACSYFDLNGPGRDPMLLARTVILGNDGSRVFRQKMSGSWDWNRFRSADPAKRLGYEHGVETLGN